MPVETEDGGDEPDGHHLAEESAEHEDQRGEKGDRHSDLKGPVAVERGASDGRQGQRRPQRRLEAGVPLGGDVAEVVDAYVGDRRQAQAAVNLRHC